MMADKVETVAIQRTLTCIGMRTMKGGKLGQGWIDDEGRTYYWGKSVPGASVGARYLWTFADESLNRAYSDVKSSSGPRYVGAQSRTDEPRVPEWEAEHYAAKTLFAQRAQAKKDQTSDLIEALRPYKEAYRQIAFPDARAAYLATIIRAITG
jgi:hypothetical protein